MDNTDLKISTQTIEIYHNLVDYYNGCNDIKCIIEESKISERIKRFYKAIKKDEKLKNYLLKRNKLLFYNHKDNNKDTAILFKINLYAYFKSEEREEVIEKIWDNITLIYLSIEESLEKKDENVFDNLTKTLEGGSLGKLLESFGDDIKNMNVNSMFEKLKANSTPESKTKATNLISDMISKLTDNMADISKSKDPSESLLANLQGLAKDYSKMFESGEMDFASFLSAVPEILNNPEEITKNIDVSKFEGIDLPDFNSMLNKSNINLDKSGLDGIRGLEGMGGLEGLSGLAGLGGMGGLEGLSGLAGGLGGLGGIGESLNKMMGGKLDEMMASMIEKTGVNYLEKMVEEENKKKEVKPLNAEQLDELEKFLKDQKLDMD
jgi:hypothetical protein